MARQYTALVNSKNEIQSLEIDEPEAPEKSRARLKSCHGTKSATRRRRKNRLVSLRIFAKQSNVRLYVESKKPWETVSGLLNGHVVGAGRTYLIASYKFEHVERLDALLVGLGRAFVLLLLKSVANGAEGTRHTITDAAVWCVALGLLLVGLLGRLGRLALHGLTDVVGGVGDAVA